MKTERFFRLYQRHRFFLSPFLLVLALGVYFDVKPLLSELNDLREQENNLLQQFRDKEQAFQQMGLLSKRLRLLNLSDASVKKPLVAQMIQLAKVNFCELVDLQTELKSSENTSSRAQGTFPLNNRLQVRLQLKGHFLHFYHFLEALLQQGLPVQLEHFSLKGEGEEIRVVAQFSAFPWALGGTSLSDLRVSDSACCVRDPFGRPRFARGDPFQDFALEDLRYVGFLSEEGKTAALILLPNGREYDIYPGSQLGKRPWHVLNIFEAYLTLRDEEQKKIWRLPRAGV